MPEHELEKNSSSIIEDDVDEHKEGEKEKKKKAVKKMMTTKIDQKAMILKRKEFQNINQKKNNNYKSAVIEEMKRIERRMQFRSIFWSVPEVACSCFLPLLIRGNFPLGSGMEIKKFFQFFRFHFKEIKRRS